MNILFAVSEIYPVIKTGGLADVAGSLPVALRELGEDVRVMIPAYRGVLSMVESPAEWFPLGDPLGVGEAHIGLTAAGDGLPPLWLVDCPSLFDRDGGPYLDAEDHDWADNHLRFALLSRAAAMLCDAGTLIGWRPDILHAHDWHTGLAPAYLAMRAGRQPASVFTVHNLDYSGVFPSRCLAEVGLPPESFTPDGVEYFGQLSFMKAGLRYSSHVTTVSPTYAQEILTEEAGHGLAGLLRSRGDRLSGILNGIDERVWDPAVDRLIVANYDADSLDDKAANKAALLDELGLPHKGGPLLGVVSRLTAQKGLDLILEVLPAIFEMGMQLVVLGLGERSIETAFREAADRYPDQLAIRLAYDEALSHRIQAGADLLLVPSRFEPCGLTQLYALRYGTLPVVRRTGGLADTVTDVDAEPRNGTGFVFGEARAASLLSALRRASNLYVGPEKWHAVQRQAMKQDFGWRASAVRYQQLFHELVGSLTTSSSDVRSPSPGRVSG